jgi:type 1 glutamine amidotransferase
MLALTSIVHTSEFMKKLLPIAACVTFLVAPTAHAAGKLKALIIDGQNNHKEWPKTTIIMRQYLADTGLFDVDIARTQFTWNGVQEASFLPMAGVAKTEDLPKPKADPDFKPDFSKYNVVISNFGYQAAPWPEETRHAFEAYVKNGGGFVSVHAADNSFPDWPEYNQMIGLGGWGGRNDKHGPYVYIDRDGKTIRDPQPGPCGTHGPLNDFLVTIRNQEHPITKGLPNFWMHASDECYSLLRGPAENMEILATSSEPEKLRKEGRNEPMLMTITFGKGRIFHTTLGHHTPSFECIGFMVTFKRGVEWAATGKVTQTEIPADFPKADAASKRPFVAPAK